MSRARDGHCFRGSHRTRQPVRKAVLAALVVMGCLGPPEGLLAQEAHLEWFPIRPISFDFAFSDRTFAPESREIGFQAGLTALRYGDLEVRAIYQFFSLHTSDFKTDQNSLYLNPRWNNFIDVFDFPAGRPLNRLLRHLLFGPLEDRAVPYLGLLGGGTTPGPGGDRPGYLVGGQVGARFPVARGLALDLTLEYLQYSIDFRDEGDVAEQWLFTTGVRF